MQAEAKIRNIKTPVLLTRIFKIIKVIFSFEMFFVLFLFAGRYKADPRFDWVPFDLTAFFFGLSFVCGVWVLIKRKFVLPQKSFILVCITTMFIVYMLASLLWTPGDLYATRKAFYVATLSFGALIATSFVIAPDKRRLKRFLIILVVFSLWVAFEAFMGYLQTKGVSFVTALSGNYIGVSRVVGIGVIVLFVYWLFKANNRFFKFLSFVVLILFMFILLVVGARGPMLATALALILPLFIGWRVTRSMNITVKKYVFLCSILVILGVLGLICMIESGHLTTTISRFLVLFESDLGASAGKRLYYYISSIHIWLNSPIWGHGIGSWPIMMGFGDVRAYPHNILLEIITELGLIGMLLFSSIIVYAFNSLGKINLIRNDPMRLIVFMLFCYTFLNAMVSGDLHDNRNLFAMIGLMSINAKEEI